MEFIEGPFSGVTEGSKFRGSFFPLPEYWFGRIIWGLSFFCSVCVYVSVSAQKFVMRSLQYVRQAEVCLLVRVKLNAAVVWLNYFLQTSSFEVSIGVDSRRRHWFALVPCAVSLDLGHPKSRRWDFGARVWLAATRLAVFHCDETKTFPNPATSSRSQNVYPCAKPVNFQKPYRK